ncbi:hypothetical protein ACLB2K_026363 [Fragaria x ananassa]
MAAQRSSSQTCSSAARAESIAQLTVPRQRRKQQTLGGAWEVRKGLEKDNGLDPVIGQAVERNMFHSDDAR